MKNGGFPLCKNCVHFRLRPRPLKLITHLDPFSFFHYKCAYFSHRDLVTGMKFNEDCYEMRDKHGPCGEEAHYFEPRPPQTPKYFTSKGTIRVLWRILFFLSHMWKKNIHKVFLIMLVLLLLYNIPKS